MIVLDLSHIGKNNLTSGCTGLDWHSAAGFALAPRQPVTRVEVKKGMNINKDLEEISHGERFQFGANWEAF